MCLRVGGVRFVLWDGSVLLLAEPQCVFLLAMPQRALKRQLGFGAHFCILSSVFREHTGQGALRNC